MHTYECKHVHNDSNNIYFLQFTKWHMDQFHLYNKIVTNSKESVSFSCFVKHKNSPIYRTNKSIINFNSVIVCWQLFFFFILTSIKIHITLPTSFNFRSCDMKNITQLNNYFSLLQPYCCITSTVKKIKTNFNTH